MHGSINITSNVYFFDKHVLRLLVQVYTVDLSFYMSADWGNDACKGKITVPASSEVPRWGTRGSYLAREIAGDQTYQP